MLHSYTFEKLGTPQEAECLSCAELDKETLELVESCLETGIRLHALSGALSKRLPDNHYHQFYGNYSLLMIKESEPERNED